MPDMEPINANQPGGAADLLGELLQAGDLEWSRLPPTGLVSDMLVDRSSTAAPGDGWEALERMAAWERVIAWAQAQQFREFAGFVEHAEANPVGQQRSHEAVESAIAEIGLRLNLSGRSANARVDDAITLRRRLPATLDALGRGEISLPVMRALADQTAQLSDAGAAEVERLVLPKTRDRTPPQVRDITRRAVCKTDPDAVRRRHRQQRRERKVSLHQEPDGMATLSLFGPAADVVGVYGVVDEHARRAGAPDDDRGLDARRADALVDLVCDGPATTDSPAYGAASDGRDDVVGTGCNDTAGAGSAGVGSAEASSARTSSTEGSHAGASPPEASPAEGETSDIAPWGTASLRQGAPRPRSRPRPGRPLVQVTVSLATLLGLNKEPGELAGYGPITAETAREIAGDATWRRIVTDPVTGALLDYGATRYTPPASLARHVTARDATCRFPGCRVPAARCDLDHGLPFDAGGPTGPANVTAKCRKHHRIKHQPGWDVTQHPNGTLTWTTPTGHTYTTVPPPF